MAWQLSMAWDDRVEVAAAITASSELAGLPGSNVGTGQPSEVWRSAEGVTTASLLIDLGASYSIAAFYLGNTNLTPAATIRLGLSTVDATGAARNALDTGTAAAGINILQRRTCRFFTPATGRYALLNIVDASLTHLEVGKLALLDAAWQPARGFKIGARRLIRDFSTKTSGVDGQERVRRGSIQAGCVFTIPALDMTEFRASAWPMMQMTGLSRDVLVCLDPADATDIGLQTYWGLLEEGTEIEHFMQRYSTVSYRIWQRL